MRKIKFQEIVKGSSPREYLESIKQDICRTKMIQIFTGKSLPVYLNLLI
jgi:hypothetical protein